MADRPPFLPPVAPPLEAYGGDYDKYARDYRVYLNLLTEYRSRSGEDARPARETLVRFAPQVQTIRSPPPPYAMAFQESSSEEERGNRSIRRLGVNSSGRRAQSPSVSVASSNVSVNSDRVRRLASSRNTCSEKPTGSQLQQALADVVEQDLIDWLIQENRAPKTYRSLNNLREMAIRRNETTGHRLMRKQSWTVVSRS